MSFNHKDKIVCIHPFRDDDFAIPMYGRIYSVKKMKGLAQEHLNHYVYLEGDELGRRGWNINHFASLELWGEAIRALVALKIELNFSFKRKT